MVEGKQQCTPAKAQSRSLVYMATNRKKNVPLLTEISYTAHPCSDSSASDPDSSSLHIDSREVSFIHVVHHQSCLKGWRLGVRMIKQCAF